MAAPDGNPIVFGGANRAVGARTLTTEQELSLTLQRETFHPFQQELMIANRVRKAKISGGSSYQWIVNGKLDADYRSTMGAYETGADNYRNNEIVRYVDREIVAIEEIHEYDEFAQWWDVRGPIVTEAGRVLGRANEVKACKALFVAGATDMPAGSDYTDIAGSNDMRTAANRDTAVAGLGGTTRAFLQASDGSAMVDAIRDISVKIYEMGDNPALYSLYLAPTDYSWFAATEAAKEVVDRDFSSNKGDYAMGVLPRISEVAIERASGIGTAAFTNVTAGWKDATYERNDYVNDNSAIIGLIARPEKAIGGVSFYDLQTKFWFDDRTDTWVYRAKTCTGYGSLESQCAFRLVATA